MGTILLRETGTSVINLERYHGREHLLLRFAELTYLELKNLSRLYPNFKTWFFTKTLPGLLSGTRTILIETINGKIAAVAILKHTLDDKRICTLRVLPTYRRRRVGSRLFELSCKILETDRPLLSVSSSTLPQYEAIFHRMSFVEKAQHVGLYVPNATELSFNGLIRAPIK